jgi:hypothetical protein
MLDPHTAMIKARLTILLGALQGALVLAEFADGRTDLSPDVHRSIQRRRDLLVASIDTVKAMQKDLGDND